MNVWIKSAANLSLVINFSSSRVYIVFSCLKKLSKFEVVFAVGLENYQCVFQVQSFRNIFGNATWVRLKFTSAAQNKLKLQWLCLTGLNLTSWQLQTTHFQFSGWTFVSKRFCFVSCLYTGSRRPLRLCDCFQNKTCRSRSIWQTNSVSSPQMDSLKTQATRWERLGNWESCER